MTIWSTSLLHALTLVAVMAHSADVPYNQGQLAQLMSELEGNSECALQLPTSLSEPTTQLHAIPDKVTCITPLSHSHFSSGCIHVQLAPGLAAAPQTIAAAQSFRTHRESRQLRSHVLRVLDPGSRCILLRL